MSESILHILYKMFLIVCIADVQYTHTHTHTHTRARARARARACMRINHIFEILLKILLFHNTYNIFVFQQST